MKKPPLPSSSLRHCLRLPSQFYIEFSFAMLAAATFAIFLEKRMGQGVFVALFFLGLVILVFCLRRLVRKVIEQRNAEGPMRGNGLAAFWVMMVVPPIVLVAALARSVGSEAVYRGRQEEAQRTLGALYSAQKKFRRDFGLGYTLSKREWGFEPKDERAYMVGIPTTCAVKEGISAERAQWPVQDSRLAEARKLEIVAYFLSVRNPEDCKNPKEGFEIYAVGVIREGAGLDVWRIDETGKLENLQRGY